jgi:hypothetical protein
VVNVDVSTGEMFQKKKGAGETCDYFNEQTSLWNFELGTLKRVFFKDFASVFHFILKFQTENFQVTSYLCHHCHHCQ